MFRVPQGAIFRKSADVRQLSPKKSLLPYGLQPLPLYIRASESLTKSSATLEINRGCKVKALFNSRSSESYIYPSLVKAAELLVHLPSSTVTMATSADVVFESLRVLLSSQPQLLGTHIQRVLFVHSTRMML